MKKLKVILLVITLVVAILKFVFPILFFIFVISPKQADVKANRSEISRTGQLYMETRMQSQANNRNPSTATENTPTSTAGVGEGSSSTTSTPATPASPSMIILEATEAFYEMHYAQRVPGASLPSSESEDIQEDDETDSP